MSKPMNIYRYTVLTGYISYYGIFTRNSKAVYININNTR
jgi:hypothetical protein